MIAFIKLIIASRAVDVLRTHVAVRFSSLTTAIFNNARVLRAVPARHLSRQLAVCVLALVVPAISVPRRSLVVAAESSAAVLLTQSTGVNGLPEAIRLPTCVVDTVSRKWNARACYASYAVSLRAGILSG